jgi:hypothetical protein
MGDSPDGCWFWNRAFRLHKALKFDCRYDSLYRTDRRATAASLAPVIPPADDIGKFLQRELMIVI